MARKSWSEIRAQLSPEQVRAVEAKIAKLESRAGRPEASARGTTSKVSSRTRRPKVVGVALPLTPAEVAAWIQNEDTAQPGFAKAIEVELSKLRRASKSSRS